jgi:hypothetical protein
MSEPKDNPKCDADQKREEMIGVMLEGVASLCAGADALERRVDSFEEEKKKGEAEPLAHKYT